MVRIWRARNTAITRDYVLYVQQMVAGSVFGGVSLPAKFPTFEYTDPPKTNEDEMKFETDKPIIQVNKKST